MASRLQQVNLGIDFGTSMIVAAVHTVNDGGGNTTKTLGKNKYLLSFTYHLILILLFLML